MPRRHGDDGRAAQQGRRQAFEVERRPLHGRQPGLQPEAGAAGEGRVGGERPAHGPVEVGRLPRRTPLVAVVLELAHHPPGGGDLLADLAQFGEVLGRQALGPQGRHLESDRVEDVIELVADEVGQVGEVAVAGLSLPLRLLQEEAKAEVVGQVGEQGLRQGGVGRALVQGQGQGAVAALAPADGGRVQEVVGQAEGLRCGRRAGRAAPVGPRGQLRPQPVVPVGARMSRLVHDREPSLRTREQCGRQRRGPERVQPGGQALHSLGGLSPVPKGRLDQGPAFAEERPRISSLLPHDGHSCAQHSVPRFPSGPAVRTRNGKQAGYGEPRRRGSAPEKRRESLDGGRKTGVGRVRWPMLSHSLCPSPAGERRGTRRIEFQGRSAREWVHGGSPAPGRGINESPQCSRADGIVTRSAQLALP